MTNLQDKTERQQLIQRFLDADISVEEEKALADFYQQTNETLPADEEPMKQLVLATTHLSDGFTNRLMRRIHEDEKKKRVQKHRQAWIYSGIAAAVALLLFMFFFFYRSHHTEKSDFIAKTDTIKTAPQTEQKQVEEQPLQKEAQKEKTDTVNKVKEIQRIVRPPKTYMAKQKQEEVPEPAIRPQMIAMGPPMEYEGVGEEIASEPTIIKHPYIADNKVLQAQEEQQSIEDMMPDEMNKNEDEREILQKIRAYCEWVDSEIRAQMEERKRLQQEITNNQDE